MPPDPGNWEFQVRTACYLKQEYLNRSHLSSEFFGGCQASREEAVHAACPRSDLLIRSAGEMRLVIAFPDQVQSFESTTAYTNADVGLIGVFFGDTKPGETARLRTIKTSRRGR
jgi:hypothetical protein